MVQRFDINGTDEDVRASIGWRFPFGYGIWKKSLYVTVFLGEESNMQEINSDFVFKDLWDMSKVLF